MDLSTMQNHIKLNHSGISRDRIVNSDQITLIEELIKCAICLEILNKPFECDSCGTLFCEDCINEWIKIKVCCPMKCVNFKTSKAKINTRKMLNLLILSCSNSPNCKYEANYWDIFTHEAKCEHQKIKCPNAPCQYQAHYQDLKAHLMNTCDIIYFECGFCKIKVQRQLFNLHLDDHYKEKTLNILNCSICESNYKLHRCLCKKLICVKCMSTISNMDVHKECYQFHTGLNYTSQIYNISKLPLPNNVEIKLLFTAVEWIRIGISFSTEMIMDQVDFNCPQYDIYYILEDLVQFYTKGNGWKNCFPKGGKALKAGDYMSITIKNGELRYAVNDIDLGSVIKIDMTKKKELYLFIHCRNNKSKAEIVYINEILE